MNKGKRLKAKGKRQNERGIALVAVLLVLMLTSALLSGFLFTATTDVQLRAVDRSRTRALYAAHGAIEKLTADLGDLFATEFAPNQADLQALEGAPPVMERMAFTATDGLGYSIVPGNGFDADGNAVAASGTVESGPYEGFTGLITPYWLWVTAHGEDGAEVRMRRRLQTVSIPVFQFGVFSETDLSFFAGPVFNFGGRVHTNGNLFLASGSTLQLADKVTAVGEVVRTHLANGWPTNNGYVGNVQPITAPGAFRNLLTTEGSLANTLGSAENEPMWTNRSIGTYNGNIRNGRTGAKRLDLPLITVGAQPIEMIRRPVPGEAALLTGQRMYSEAGVRILLSNTAEAITALPDSSNGTAPIRLDTLASLQDAGYVGAIQPAASTGVTAAGYRMGAGTPSIDGFLKVEYRNNAGGWTDVTAEVLNLGFTRRNLEVGGCAAVEPSPNAIIRFQRVRTAPSPGAGAPAACGGAVAGDYWPLVLYDTREGKPRDNEAVGSANIYLGGVIHYIEFDVNNFRRWLAGTIGASGPSVVNEGGFTVYFSDRRTNMNGAGNETGEYGFEDVVNLADPNGVPNGAPDAGEDLNVNGVHDLYGATPRFPAGMADVGGLPANLGANLAAAPLTAAARPNTVVTAAVAKANRPVFFRRALKIVNGASGNLPADGLNVTSENPVYVVGPFNASNAAFDANHAAAAIIADAVTLLSPGWADQASFTNPNNPAARPRTTTYYRFATISGKNRSFQWNDVSCGGVCYQDYGTDAGTHNFLRMLEGGGQTVNYRGSLISFYYSRQAVGVYKCCVNVYNPPTRAYNFDIEFLNPALLPPKTPMFRDLNTTGFMQVTRR
jgi:hypothetical protein